MKNNFRSHFAIYIPIVISSCINLYGQTTKSVLTDNKLSNRIDSIVHTLALNYMQDSNATGMSIGIYSKGKKYIYNYGEIRRGSNILPGADNFYGLGSIDKTFAAALLAQAILEKRVRLNDDIRKFLGGDYSNLVYGGEPVRFVNLANHTSGFPVTFRTFTPQIMDSLRSLTLAGQADYYAHYTADSLVADLHLVKLDTIPGKKYRYNNNDIKVLILLLEKIYKQPYQQILTRFLKTHLGMYDTKTELSQKQITRASTGYFKKNEPQEFVNFKGLIAGPTVISTINDMLKYLQANLSEKDKALRLTHQRTFGKTEGFAMGLGWMIDNDSNGERFIYHDGNTRLGFNALCIFYPQRNLGFIIIVNDNIDLKKLGNLEDGIKKELQKTRSSRLLSKLQNQTKPYTIILKLPPNFIPFRYRTMNRPVMMTSAT